MTNDRRATDWGDDRLAAAFAARSGGGPAPSDLVAATIERLRINPRPVRGRFRFAHLGAAAAAAVILAIVAVGLSGPRPATGPGETNGATFGLEPITVSEAIAIRDGGVDDRELAVAGWFANVGLPRCGPHADGPAPYVNPARSDCPLTWLMEQPEQLVTATATVATGQFPRGPALNPGLTLVQTVDLPNDPSIVVQVTFIGHFDDRRAEFCPDDERSSCVDTFVVDRVAIIDGRILETSTVRDLETMPASTEASIDARVRGIDPTLRVLSRRVTTTDRIGTTEPVFQSRGPIERARDPAWLAVALPPIDAGGRSVARTFLIPDGGAEPIFEIARGGEFPVTPAAPADSPSPPPTARSSEARFPRAVLGLGVSSIRAALDLHPNFDNAELAIRGWYVPPDPAVDCPGSRDRVRPLRPLVCPGGRHWLLDEPENLWSDVPTTGVVRQPAGRYLNPIIPSDVVFDVPDPWSGAGPDPVPVVVVGHFADPRISAPYPGIESFVVDQLAWAAGEARASGAVRLVDDMVESGADVLARVDRALGPGSGDWISLVHGSDLAILDPRVASSASELTRASTVWAVRRLVSEEVDGVLRTVVDFAYTADGTDRVWTGNSCCALELATTIDVELPRVGSAGGTVEVRDYLGMVVAARMAGPDEFSGWRPVGPAEGWWLEVAPGATPAELAIRWTADRCDTTWNLTVREGPWLDLTRPFVEGCETANGIPRVIVLTFDKPIDVDSVGANDSTSGG
jgi:hypothetical protein